MGDIVIELAMYLVAAYVIFMAALIVLGIISTIIGWSVTFTGTIINESIKELKDSHDTHSQR